MSGIDRRHLMIGVGSAAALVPMGGIAAAPARVHALVVGRDQPFDDDWSFLRGSAPGAEAPGYGDAQWRRVDLPHDWSIEDAPGAPSSDRIGPFEKDAVGGAATGYTLGGEGWYRKRFRIPAIDGGRVRVRFDGVAVTCRLWINGRPLGEHLYPYSAFTLDLTPHLDPAGDNVLAVQVMNPGRNSRWYVGSGIYRGVTLDVLPAGAAIVRDGVEASTRRITGGRATVEVSAAVEGATDGLVMVQRLVDPGGRVLAEASTPAAATVRQTLIGEKARLWSPADPHLYTLESELRRGKRVIDRVTEPFGIRIVAIEAANGLRINGQSITLRGGCLHHDNGLLGACAFADADDRRIRLLKARGFNAIRSSHNPSSATLRAACDRHGMLLIEEALDMWHLAKTPEDHAQYLSRDWQEVVGAMVRAARNSPSVIMWSIGNEVPGRSSPQGVEWSWKLANEVRRLDPTRPVTAALNGVLGDMVVPSNTAARPGRGGVADNASTVFLDVAGYNYRLDEIESDHASQPERVIYASETFTRDAYDYARLTERAPYMLGEFLWAAMDYIGEAAIAATGNVPKAGIPYYMADFPYVGSSCGDLDLIGDQKAPSRSRDVIWGVSPLEMAVQRPVPADQVEIVSLWGWHDELQSWSWPDAGAAPLTVRLYTPGDRVELRLNGRPVGERKLTATDRMRAELTVPYAPGRLEAIAWSGGREIGRRTLHTVGPAARLRLTEEKAASVGRGRQALRFVTVEVTDRVGNVLPDAQVPVTLTLAGGATLAGFGSGNPRATGSFQAATAQTFHGRSLAIMRGGIGRTARIEARAEGLLPAALRVDMA